MDVWPSFGVSWQEDEDTSVGLGIGLGARYFIKNLCGGGAFFYSKSGPKGSKYNSKYLELKLGHLVGIAKNIYLDLGFIYSDIVSTTNLTINTTKVVHF